MRTLDAWADLPLCWVKHDRHVVFGLACPYPGRESTQASTRAHLMLGLPALAPGQTRASGGVGAGFPCPGPEPSMHATWCWGWFALFLGLKVRPDVALGQKIIIFFSINIFNDNKDNNLCAPNNNIFYINSLNTIKINITFFNYNKNKNICIANNNIFDINALTYNRNSNIYNTNNSININTFNYNKNDNIYGTNNNNNNNNF